MTLRLLQYVTLQRTSRPFFRIRPWGGGGGGGGGDLQKGTYYTECGEKADIVVGDKKLGVASYVMVGWSGVPQNIFDFFFP
jgi:hypothetical protein